jgi:hypothetical protein
MAKAVKPQRICVSLERLTYWFFILDLAQLQDRKSTTTLLPLAFPYNLRVAPLFS